MAYHEEKIASGSLVVSISGHDGNMTAVFYVNARDGLAQASAVTSRDFKSIAGARRWAAKMLAA